MSLSEKPLALHFAGHGMKAEYMEGNFKKDFLVFEDENGKANFISGLDIKDFLNKFN